jgi:hypothetical protein
MYIGITAVLKQTIDIFDDIVFLGIEELLEYFVAGGHFGVVIDGGR